MNNERYLFRGKRISENTWVEGYYISFEYEYIGGDSPESKIGHFIFPLNSKEEEMHIPVIPETVGQFTGLTDKNGTKIFEGDRFKTPNGFIGRIEWGHKVYIDKKNIYECHGWLYVNDSNNHSETLDSEILAGEVIGSIHDNDKAVNP